MSGPDAVNDRLPLVLLPALLCDEELFRAQVTAIADLADPLVLDVVEPSLEAAAARVLQRAPTRFALAGTSAGGNLALEVLAAAPSRVVGLWLTGSNAAAHRDPAGARRLDDRVRAGEFDKVVDELAARCIHASGPRAAEALGTLRRMARRCGPDVFLLQNEAVITRRDRSSVLDGLAVPTLLLWGRHDQFAPPERAAAIASRLPFARLEVLDDCGHLPTLEHPDESTQAVRHWLQSITASAI
jgi:pimeloyl-ACP methyl ester carboxylesterase